MAVSASPPRLRLPAIVQTLVALYRPEEYVVWVLRRYAPRRVVGMKAIFLGRFFSVSDAGAVKEVFTADRDASRAGVANAEILGPSVGRTSLLRLDGEEHLRMRRLLLPPFHGEAVRRYATLVDEIAADDVGTWPVGREFPVLAHMQAVTLEVILRTVIGVRDTERLGRLRALLPEVLGIHPFAVVFEARRPHLQDSLVGRRLPWIRARRRAIALLREEIAEHRREGVDDRDVLALLMSARGEDGTALSDEELVDQLLTLLIAGHETSAAALAWAFERLVRAPDALRRLQQEVRGGGDGTYLDAVVSETLRTRPPLEAAWRRLAAPLALAGYELPAGSLLAVSIRGAHRRDTFPEPRAFRPERFLEGSPPSYSLVPFGGGTRRCIGASFATMEMKRVLTSVLARVELRSTSARAEAQSRGRFTTVPARGGRIVVERRL